jgi:uncharacterized membrane protein
VHGHSSPEFPDDASTLRLRATPRVALAAALLIAALATVWGVVQLWPGSYHPASSASGAYASPGVIFPPATVLTVQPPCPQPAVNPSGGADGTPFLPSAPIPACGKIAAQVLSGADRGKVVQVTVPREVSLSGLTRGDRVQLLRTPPAQQIGPTYAFGSVERTTPLWIESAAFLLVLVLVARVRGLLALAGLAFAGVVLIKFMIPALLEGRSGLAVALVGSAAIMFVVLYLAHGLSMRTSVALAGTLVGVCLISVVGEYAVHAARLTGVVDESAGIMGALVGNVSLQGLLTCGVIVAGLGVLNDVTITQASAVWELRAAAPDMPRRQLFGSAMRIGRDHIASTVYTLVFAYVGIALPVLLLITLYNRPVLDLLNSEDIAEEIVRTLAGAIGLMMAVPATTAIGILVVSSATSKRQRAAPSPAEDPVLVS